MILVVVLGGVFVVMVVDVVVVSIVINVVLLSSLDAGGKNAGCCNGDSVGVSVRGLSEL